MALGLAVFALALIGCGSDDSGTAASLTKAQFIKKADAICGKAEEERVEAMNKISDSLGNELRKNAEKLVEAGLPFYKKATEEITEIGLPEGQEAEVEAIIRSREVAAEKAEKDPARAGTSNDFWQESGDLQKQFGFENCRV